MILQAAKHLPQCLKTLSGLLHVLSANLLLSVKRIGHHWQICQSRCSLVKVSWSVWCWAVSTGNSARCCHLTSYYWSPFLTGTLEVIFRALAVDLTFLLPQRNRYHSCCWVNAFQWPCPALLTQCWRLCWETLNILVMAHIDMPSWAIRMAVV